jgi:hypothetical protein
MSTGEDQMGKKRFNATSFCLIFPTSLLLTGCNIFSISPDDVSGSCVYGDTETDTPVSLVTDIDSNFLYFGATDSPYKYEIDWKSKDELTAVLKDSNALKSMYLIHSSLKLNIGSGSVVVENVPESGLEHSGENTEVQATCTWFDKASYQTKLMEATQAFSQNTPSAIAQSLNDRTSYEARANAPQSPPINNAPYPSPKIDLVLFDITKHLRRGNSTYPELTITARADENTLTDISINRSNCQLLYVIKNGYGDELPLKLSFGDKVKFRGLCDPSEVTLSSDQGSSTFTW